MSTASSSRMSPSGPLMRTHMLDSMQLSLTETSTQRGRRLMRLFVMLRGLSDVRQDRPLGLALRSYAIYKDSYTMYIDNLILQLLSMSD